MKMRGIAIIDDQKDFIKLISDVVKRFYEKRGSIYKIYLYDSGERFLFQLEELKCDIYILDIEMPGKNGLQLAEKIRKYNEHAIIIFVTCYSKYALKAYEVEAYKYILKDQINIKLEETLDKIEKKLEVDDKDYYIINTKVRYEKIYYKEILYIYKEGKNSIIVKTNETTFLRSSIQDVYKELDPNQFIFIDRGCLVNIAHIMRIYSNEMYIRNGDKLVISRVHVNKVKEGVHRYWRNNI